MASTSQTDFVHQFNMDGSLTEYGLLVCSTLGPAGEALWQSIVAESGIAFRPDELLLIGEAARTADLLSELRATDGSPVEIRLQQDALRKLLRSVDWPVEDGGASRAGRALAEARWSGRG